MMRVNSDSKNQQTLNRKPDVHESTCQKGMMNKTYQEDVKDEAYTLAEISLIYIYLIQSKNRFY
jgi:hypothetical protein